MDTLVADYVDFASMCAANGLAVQRFNTDHWRVTGKGRMVDYWPDSRRRTAVVIDSKRTIRGASFEDVIMLATETPAVAALKCPECDGTMQLRLGRFGRFYGCSRFPVCRATHGAHADGRPLGIPADTATKQSRIRAHAAFDTLWKNGDMSRGAAYQWLRGALGMTADECHIGRFTSEQCERVIASVAGRAVRNVS